MRLHSDKQVLVGSTIARSDAWLDAVEPRHDASAPLHLRQYSRAKRPHFSAESLTFGACFTRLCGGRTLKNIENHFKTW